MASARTTNPCTISFSSGVAGARTIIGLPVCISGTGNSVSYTHLTFSPWRRAPHRTSFEPYQELFADWKTKNPLVMLKRVFCPVEVGPAADYTADTVDVILSLIHI